MSLNNIEDIAALLLQMARVFLQQMKAIRHAAKGLIQLVLNQLKKIEEIIESFFLDLKA